MQRLFIAGIIVLACSLPFCASAQSATSSTLTLSKLLGTSTPVELSTPLGQKIASSSALAGSIAAPILHTIDLGRIAVAGFLQGQIAFTAQKLPGNDIFMPNTSKTYTNTGDFDWNKVLHSVVGVLWTVYFFLLVIARFLIAKFVFCYILLVVAVMYILFKIYRYVRK